MRKDCLERFLAHNVRNQLSLDLVRSPTEQARTSLADGNISQIGAASGQQKRRIAQDGCEVGLVAAYRSQIVIFRRGVRGPVAGLACVVGMRIWHRYYLPRKAFEALTQLVTARQEKPALFHLQENGFGWFVHF